MEFKLLLYQVRESHNDTKQEKLCNNTRLKWNNKRLRQLFRLSLKSFLLLIQGHIVQIENIT